MTRQKYQQLSELHDHECDWFDHSLADSEILWDFQQLSFAIDELSVPTSVDVEWLIDSVFEAVEQPWLERLFQWS